MQTLQNSGVFNDINFWINVCISVVTFIAIFIIREIKKTNDDQWKTISRIEKQLNTLQGEHNIMCKKHEN